VGPVLALLRQPETVVPVARSYVFAALPGVLPFYLYVVLRQTLQALGWIRPVLWTVLLANLANVFLNWVLIYGNLGAPALGAAGAGFASSASRVVMVAGVLAAAWAVLRPYLMPLRPEALRARPLLRMVALGAPVGAQLQLEYGAFAVIGVCMGWLGTAAIASHQVAINLASLAFMVPLGVAQAAAVLVGRAVGRQDPPGARRAAGAGLLVGGAFMLLTATVFLTLPRLLAGIYTRDAEVLLLAALLLPIAGLFQVFDGLQVVATAVLRGVGDTRVPMILHVAGFWLVGLPVSLWLGFGVGAGPVGLWAGLAAGLGAVSVLLLVRMARSFAGDLRRLDLEDGLPLAAVRVPSPGATGGVPPR
jgi:multidrug resistance protein, MATE family